jgi:hypothetical protein
MTMAASSKIFASATPIRHDRGFGQGEVRLGQASAHELFFLSPLSTSLSSNLWSGKEPAAIARVCFGVFVEERESGSWEGRGGKHLSCKA